MAVAHRMYAQRALRGRPGRGRLEEPSRPTSRRSRARSRTSPSCARSSATRRSTRARRRACSGEIAAGADELVRNFVRLVAEKGRAGELVEISAELQALVARAQNRLAVELTTAHELSDDEARSIVEKIETGVRPDGRGDALGRPEPDRGIVLRIGSFRADGSVRGRLERLRQELATAH